MDGDVVGVRIVPPIVEFLDVHVNQPSSVQVTVQNISKFSKRIRFHAPVSNVSECFNIYFSVNIFNFLFKEKVSKN